jgi:hypothetical protein
MINRNIKVGILSITTNTSGVISIKEISSTLSHIILMEGQKCVDINLIDTEPPQDISSPELFIPQNLLEKLFDFFHCFSGVIIKNLSDVAIFSLTTRVVRRVEFGLGLNFVDDPLRNPWARF